MKKILLICLTLLLAGSLFSQEFRLIDTWRKNQSAIECITLSPEGDKILVGHHDGSLALWDLNKKMMVAEYHAHRGLIQTIIFNNEKTRFVTAGHDSKVVVWEYPSMKIVKTFKTSEDINNFAVLTSDGNSIYFGGYYSKYGYGDEPYTAIYKIDINTGAENIVFAPKQATTLNYTGLTDGDLDPTGQYVVITKDEKVIFYNWKTRKVEKTFAGDYELNNIIFYKDLAFLWGDKMLMRLEQVNGKYEVTHTVLAGTHDAYNGYSDMIISADEKLLVTGDDDHNVNIWDAESMIKKQILFGHTDVVRAFVFCQADTVLITGGYDGQLLVWSFKHEIVKNEEKKPEEVVFAENNIPLKIKDRGVDLQSNLIVHESEFDIQIYDNRVEDGDSISLNLNGEWILKDHRVTKSKYTMHVKINEAFTNNYLILYAHNLGEISPNTAAVTVLIGGQEFKLSLSSDLKKSGALNFEYKP
jgi:WD40 repeat protein